MHAGVTAVLAERAAIDGAQPPEGRTKRVAEPVQSLVRLPILQEVARERAATDEVPGTRRGRSAGSGSMVVLPTICAAVIRPSGSRMMRVPWSRRCEQVDALPLIDLAGGTTARQFIDDYGPIPIDGLEIGPQTVAIGRRYVAMDAPNLDVFVEDGRYFLERAERRADVIATDAYR